MSNCCGDFTPLSEQKMAISIEKAADRKGYVMKAECIVPRPLDEVFEFFSNAANLQTLTPAWMRFRILTPQPIEMAVGKLIDYKLKVHGLPIRWRSEITAWEPNVRFIDELRKGPYTHWHHEHLFESCDDGTRVIDIVHYGVPGGAIVHGLLVRRDIEKIFGYRQKVLKEILGEATPSESPVAELATSS